MNFPEKLQKLRKERGWSQEELANRITVSRQAVSKWELGTAVPDTDNIVQLSELFGVTTDYLIKDGLDSDEDIPAVARTAEKVKNAEQSRQLLIAGIVTLVLGVIIIGVLLTLSQVIESYQKVTYDHGPMMEMLPDGTTQISDEHRMATTRVPVYSFIPFLNTYYLHWVLVIGIGLVIASIVCFAKYRRKIKTKRNHKNRGLPHSAAALSVKARIFSLSLRSCFRTSRRLFRLSLPRARSPRGRL